MSEPSWSGPGYAAVAEVIARRAGLVFPQARVAAAEAIIQDSMKRHGIGRLSEYRVLIDTEGAARDELLAQLTIGETYFFRDPAQLAHLRDTLLPALARKGNAPIRIWSAACASGEEPYSLAIIAQQLGLLDRVLVYGTDISRPRLEAAVRGHYKRWSLRGVPEELVHKFFRVDNGSHILIPEIRRHVEFHYINLAEDQYPSLNTGLYAMDLILCRNVLIYFDRETIARVARGLIDSLAPHGWLVIGASDPMISDYVDCDVVVTPAGLAYRRPQPHYRETAWERAVPEPEPLDLWTHDELAVDAALVQSLLPAAEAPGPDTVDEPPQVQPAAAQTPGERIRELANAGRLEEAGRICASALDSAPPTAELLHLHAVLLAEAGRHADAAQIARKALYLDRTFVLAQLALGHALARMDDARGAARAYRNAAGLLDKLPDDAAIAGAPGESVLRLRELVRVQLSLLKVMA